MNILFTTTNLQQSYVLELSFVKNIRSGFETLKTVSCT